MACKSSKMASTRARTGSRLMGSGEDEITEPAGPQRRMRRMGPTAHTSLERGTRKCTVYGVSRLQIKKRNVRTKIFSLIDKQ